MGAYGSLIVRCVSALSHTDVRFITALSRQTLYRCAKREGTNLLLMNKIKTGYSPQSHELLWCNRTRPAARFFVLTNGI